MSKKPRDPCKPLACAIQACLNAHNFQEASCQEAIENLTECCRKWKGKSLVCSGMIVDSTEGGESNVKSKNSSKF